MEELNQYGYNLNNNTLEVFKDGKYQDTGFYIKELNTKYRKRIQVIDFDTKKVFFSSPLNYGIESAVIEFIKGFYYATKK